MLKIEEKGLHKVLNFFQALPKTIENEIELAVNKATQTLLARAKQKASGEVLKNPDSHIANHGFGFKGGGASAAKGRKPGTLKEIKAATGFGKLKDDARRTYLLKQSGRGIGTDPTQLKANTRGWAAKLPERSFLHSALRELEPSIRAELNEAIERAVKQ